MKGPSGKASAICLFLSVFALALPDFASSHAESACPTLLKRSNLGRDIVGWADSDGGRPAGFDFQLSEDRWVFISAKAGMSPGGWIELGLTGTPGAYTMRIDTDGGAREAMVKLKAGPHRLTVKRSPTARLTRLRARQVPALIYNKVGATQKVRGTQIFDWPFLDSHILASVNTLVSAPGLVSPEMGRWRSQGGEWWVEMPLPKTADDPDSLAEACADRIGALAMTPDAVLLDEMDREDRPFEPWLSFLSKMQSRLAAGPTAVIPYWGGHCETDDAQQFIAAAFRKSITVVREIYLPEPAEIEDPHALLKRELIPQLTQFPGASGEDASKLMVALGYLSVPSQNLDGNPQLDFKVWLDLQMYALATDPRLGNLGGVMFYSSRNADEEYARWAARLFRHYAVEGRTDFLSETLGYSFVLTHIRNGNFDDGFAAWNIHPALAESVSLGTNSNFGRWQGLMDQSQGGSFALLKPHPSKSSRLTQAVRHLTPGRLYSLRFVTANIGALTAGVSTKQANPVKALFIGADVLNSRSFEQPVATQGAPPFTKESPPMVHFHRIVFRAGSSRVVLELTIPPSQDGAPAGEPTALTGVQIQPYFLE